MAVQKNNSSEDASYWSLRLLVLLQEMAAQKTNAVLQVLVDVDQLETECRYPESGLLFADKHWRVFYHCHEAASMHADEHGHFHLFTDIGNQAWAHVAGLSLGAEVQPLQWFAVNRWVTDGPWLESETFFDQMKYVTDDNESLVASWLSVLLQLYRVPLFELLEKRDLQIKLKLKNRDQVDALDDRDLYTLATLPIDLQATLEKHLLHKNQTEFATMKNKVKAQYGV